LVVVPARLQLEVDVYVPSAFIVELPDVYVIVPPVAVAHVWPLFKVSVLPSALRVECSVHGGPASIGSRRLVTSPLPLSLIVTVAAVLTVESGVFGGWVNVVFDAPLQLHVPTKPSECVVVFEHAAERTAHAKKRKGEGLFIVA
jgi:hypothetical protein